MHVCSKHSSIYQEKKSNDCHDLGMWFSGYIHYFITKPFTTMYNLFSWNK